MNVRTHRRRRPAELVVRLLVVACLAVDAVVHLRHADAMQLAAPGGVGGGTLFRAQAAVAGMAAVLLLVTGRRFVYLLAALAALSALVPVLLYTYVQVPALGPIPSMYDPAWHPEKVASAVAEGLAVVLAGVGFALTRRPADSSLPGDSAVPPDSAVAGDSAVPPDSPRRTDSPRPPANSP